MLRRGLRPAEALALITDARPLPTTTSVRPRHPRARPVRPGWCVPPPATATTPPRFLRRQL